MTDHLTFGLRKESKLHAVQRKTKNILWDKSSQDDSVVLFNHFSVMTSLRFSIISSGRSHLDGRTKLICC
jgi:hypothetical protein